MNRTITFRPLVPTLLVACVLGLFVMLGGVAACTGDGGGAAAATSEPDLRTVSATGTGTANGVPDNLQVGIGVETTGDSAAAVLSDNNDKTRALLAELKSGGVDDKDVRTASVNLGPRYDNDGKINGYSANNQLEVTFRDLGTAGAKLDLLVKSAGDSARVQSVQLGFNDDEGLKAAARVDGVKRARVQAEAMAEAAGAKLGRVRTITEVVPSNDSFTAVGATAADAASPVPIAAGSQDLTVEVQVVFDLA